MPYAAHLQIKVFRFPDRDHPRVVLAVGVLPPPGYKLLHLTRPVSFHSKEGKPAWLSRALSSCRAALAEARSSDTSITFAQLSALAEQAHSGKGIKKT